MPDAMAIRDSRLNWACPNSGHDRTVRRALVVLPTLIGALAGAMLVMPFITRTEMSFVLKKEDVERASERMRLTAAQYRGQDDKGRPFVVRAGSAVQRSSRTPVVELSDMAAQITLSHGPAMLQAPGALYNMDSETVVVPGSVQFTDADDYRLSAANVSIDLKGKKLSGNSSVSGNMPLGSFAASRLNADLDARTVVLDGGARLHIVQSPARAR